jgi:DNA-binding MarR family transcriptional regulator
MSHNSQLRPLDVPVALALVDSPNATFQQISDTLGISSSTAYESVERLRCAGLVRAGNRREVLRRALLEFLEHGVRYAFPCLPESSCRGVPTSHAGPALASVIAADEPMVWPSQAGSAVGPGIVPLFKQAPELPQRSPKVYDLLTLVDALRVGRVRERAEAVKILTARFYPNASLAA